MFDFLDSADKQNNTPALLTYNVVNTISKFGSVSRGVCETTKDNYLKHIVEHTKIFSKNKKIYSELDSQTIELKKNIPISMNFMGFTPSVFPYINTYFSSFLKENSEKLNAEFYLPSLLQNMIINKDASIIAIPTNEQWFGVTYKEDKAFVVKSIQEKIDAGEYPVRLYKNHQNDTNDNITIPR